FAATVGKHRANEMPGRVLGLRRSVALQAGVGLTDKLRPILLLLLERVEDVAEPRIRAADLEHLAELAITDVHLVVEIQGTRRLRADAMSLQTGLRENEHLRRPGHSQGLQKVRQVTMILVER